MILKALYDYYHRDKDNLPQLGRELKQIGFIIVISKDGKFVRFEDQRIDKKTATSFLVKKSVSRTSAPSANFLYDNSAYVLGISDKGKPENDLKCLNVFKAKIEEVYHQHPNVPELSALHNFYLQSKEEILDAIKIDPLWDTVQKELNKKYSTFSFRIEGDTKILAEREELISLYASNNSERDAQRICLITGDWDDIVDTTTATMIPGSQATAKLVAFQVSSGYDSYGKNKGYNAPIGKKAEFAYTTALNHMLASGSRNKFLIGNRTFVFWASNSSEASTKAEISLFDMLGLQEANNDPNAGIEQVRKVFKAIYSGELSTSLDDKFYILGLAPNAARIAVTYWSELMLKDFAANIVKHFDDMEIVQPKGNESYSYMGLRAIISAVTLGGKASDATPNLPEAIAKSIFQGTPYPYQLLASCIRRIRAEQSIGLTRAAIIKACLIRYQPNQTITNMLNKENNNPAYLCGRLFAVLVKIQEDANNAHTIRERYMNAASATPATVFPTILNLSNHHAENLASEGNRIYYEKLKQEIMGAMTDEFPVHLSLHDQGCFFLGYYQQRQNLFTSKKEQIND